MKIFGHQRGRTFTRSLLFVLILYTITFACIDGIIYKLMRTQLTNSISATIEIQNLYISKIFEETAKQVRQMATDKEIVNYLKNIKNREDVTNNPRYNNVKQTLYDIDKLSNKTYLAWIANEVASFYIDSKGIISDQYFDVHSRIWFDLANNAYDVTFTQPYYEYTTKELAISCVLAIRENNNIIGYVASDISLKDLPDIMKNYVIGKNGRSILISDEGNIVFSTEIPRSQEVIGFNQLQPYIEDLKQIPNRLKQVTIGKKKYFLTYQEILVNGWGIMQLIDEREMMQEFNSTMTAVFAIIVINIFVLVSIIIFNIVESIIIQKKLNYDATTDYLTKVNNRKYFMDLADDKIKQAKNDNNYISLLMIDIDHFKEINDHYGHATGDIVLEKVAEHFSLSVRKTDIFCRYGGDEFTFLVIAKDKAEVEYFANRLRNDIKNLYIPIETGAINLTISVGGAFMEESEDLQQLFIRADQALYEVKKTGRNNVIII